jgi:hypothetical protein
LAQLTKALYGLKPTLLSYIFNKTPLNFAWFEGSLLHQRTHCFL